MPEDARLAGQYSPFPVRLPHRRAELRPKVARPYFDSVGAQLLA